MKVLFPFFLFLLSASFLSANAGDLTPDEAKKSYPYAKLDVQDIEFGQIGFGEPVAARVHVTNEGSYDLHIAKARSSCGLMIQTWPSAPIKPGETVPLNFRFDSSRKGEFSRIITIHTNAWNKDLTVKVTGEIIPEEER